MLFLDYDCAECKAKGNRTIQIKLWRPAGESRNPRLLCAWHTSIHEGKDISSLNHLGQIAGLLGIRTDHIGNFVPAIPTEDQINFYTMARVPREKRIAWRNLANSIS